jgi:hypothetical protein
MPSVPNGSESCSRNPEGKHNLDNKKPETRSGFEGFETNIRYGQTQQSIVRAACQAYMRGRNVPDTTKHGVGVSRALLPHTGAIYMCLDTEAKSSNG